MKEVPDAGVLWKKTERRYEMKITIIVGNGFDMSFGIKSSYKEFYKWYCKQPSNDKIIDNFKCEIQKDIDAGGENWSDFELGLGKYTKEFTPDTVEQFLICREDAITNIRKYLLLQEEEFKETSYYTKAVELFQRSIWNFYSEVSDAEQLDINQLLNANPTSNREISFLSFNYTDTLERILDKIASDELAAWTYSGTKYIYKLDRNIIHIHGTNNRFPISGVNDETQIINQDLVKLPQFKEILVKSESVNALGQLWHTKAEQQISNSQFVCILGMSLGASDAKWWRKLSYWLRADKKRRLIIYWYENNDPGGISAFKQLRCINKVKNKLLSYADMNDIDKDEIRQRIFVVINTKNFLRLKNQNIVEEDKDAVAI